MVYDEYEHEDCEYRKSGIGAAGWIIFASIIGFAGVVGYIGYLIGAMK